jgi:hypothetical protein
MVKTLIKLTSARDTLHGNKPVPGMVLALPGKSPASPASIQALAVTVDTGNIIVQ